MHPGASDSRRQVVTGLFVDKRRPSRRAFLRLMLLAGGGVVGLATVSCGPSAPTTPAAPTGSPPTVSAAPTTGAPVASPTTSARPTQAPAVSAGPAGKVTMALGGDAVTLDPHLIGDIQSHSVARNIFEGLMRWDWTSTEAPGSSPQYRIWKVEKKLVPNLAESYETVDDNTWIFRLRKGIKFHNGEPFNAEAVKFSIERMLNPDTKATGRASISLIEKVEATDEYTVKILTSKPFPILPIRLAYSASGSVIIVPPKYYSSTPADQLSVKPVGTGPWKFVSWTKGSELVLEANPEYWRGAPAVKTVVFRPVPESGTRISALLSGEVDLAANISPDQIDRVKASGVARVSETLHGLTIPVFQIDCLHETPVKNKKVRQALNYAVDMDAIVKNVLSNHATPLGPTLSPSDFGFNPNIKPYPYDPAKAKQLLAEAGYPNGFEITFFTPNGRYMNDKAVSEAVAGYLNKVGIKATVQVKEWSNYIADARKKDNGPFFIWGWGSIGDGELLVDQFHPKALYATYENKEFEDVLDRARTEMNKDRRRELFYRAQEILYEDAAYIKGYEQTAIYGVNNRVQWEAALGEWPFLYGIQLK